MACRALLLDVVGVVADRDVAVLPGVVGVLLVDENCCLLPLLFVFELANKSALIS